METKPPRSPVKDPGMKEYLLEQFKHDWTEIAHTDKIFHGLLKLYFTLLSGLWLALSAIYAWKLGKDTVILTISADLPFAQQRFCEAETIGGTQVFSDSVWKDFAKKYGILIKDMGILARSIFIVDRNGTLKYVELVKEISSQPDYDEALDRIRKLR